MSGMVMDPFETNLDLFDLDAPQHIKPKPKPVRKAPKPPKPTKKKPTEPSGKTSMFPKFFSGKSKKTYNSLAQSPLSPNMPSNVDPKKKQAPPRPPPPVFNSKTKRLGSRKHEELNSGSQVAPSNLLQDPKSSNSLLIDLSSPPTSPSVVTSGSDGLSINSLGSESSNSLLDAPSSWPNAAPTKPINFDPFGSIEEETVDSSVNSQMKVGGSSFYQDSVSSGQSIIDDSGVDLAVDWSKATISSCNDNGSLTNKQSAALNSNKKSGAVWHSNSVEQAASGTKVKRPTIIRAKPTAASTNGITSKVVSPVQPEINIVPVVQDVPVPPVAPVESSVVFAVAEYDFDSNEVGDLPLKAGDRVELIASINDDWLEGRLNGKQGLFPTAFVKIEGALESVSCVATDPMAGVRCSENEVTVLYSFNAEMNSDLDLREGERVTITAVVEGGQWLLGHCNGRSGQFPATFVDRIPENLPVVTL